MTLDSQCRRRADLQKHTVNNMTDYTHVPNPTQNSFAAQVTSCGWCYSTSKKSTELFMSQHTVLRYYGLNNAQKYCDATFLFFCSVISKPTENSRASIPRSFSPSMLSCSLLRPRPAKVENCQLRTSDSWLQLARGGFPKNARFCEWRGESRKRGGGEKCWHESVFLRNMSWCNATLLPQTTVSSRTVRLNKNQAWNGWRKDLLQDLLC